MMSGEDKFMLRRPRVWFLALGIVLFALMGVSPAAAEDTFWHVVGIHPKGYTLDIKAVDSEGKLYDIKAIEQDENVHMLDVKALVGDLRQPVKVVVSDDRYAPVQAIDIKGNNLDLKALTPEGKLLDVKGVRRTGSIIHIKVLGIGGRFFAVKAIAPDGRMYDVKGIKMIPDRAEMLIGTVQIHAHVKAIPPAESP
jgi:hypothetical protein